MGPKQTRLRGFVYLAQHICFVPTPFHRINSDGVCGSEVKAQVFGLSET